MQKVKVVTYSFIGAARSGQQLHPSEVIKQTGIEYKKWVPQTISDSIQLWGASNIPDDLPSYIEVSEEDPSLWVGLGLSKEDAENLQCN